MADFCGEERFKFVSGKEKFGKVRLSDPVGTSRFKIAPVPPVPIPFGTPFAHSDILRLRYFLECGRIGV